MSLPRFFVEQFPEHGTVELIDAEAHHAIRALRSQVGDDLLVFDGKGYEGFGTIREIGKKWVVVEISNRRFAPRDSDGRLHFAVALPKGERQRNVIERLVELGADSLTPIESSRSVARFDEDAMERLARHELESCKQCQRNRRMEIRPAATFESYIDHCDGPSTWMAHPSDKAIGFDGFLSKFSQNPSTGTTQIHFLIGPEGGFTDEEVETAVAKGVQVLSLGERILRVETAVAAAATLALTSLMIRRSIDSRL